jgi:hypothetical protein
LERQQRPNSPNYANLVSDAGTAGGIPGANQILLIMYFSVFRYFKEHLGETSPEPESESTGKQAKIPVQPASHPFSQSILFPLLCMLIVVQLYIVLELRKISLAVQSLQADHVPGT